MHSFDVRTQQRNQFVDITDRVRQALRGTRVQQGICVVYCPQNRSL